MTDLRKLAKGKPCQVRIPGVCNRQPETTVLAHYRLVGLSGIGMKAPDVIGAWACYECHEEVDRRTIRVDITSARLMHAEGCLRTQVELMRLGELK